MTRADKFIKLSLITAILLIPLPTFSESLELQKMKQMLDQMDNPPAQIVMMYEKLKQSEMDRGIQETKRLSDFSCKDDIAKSWDATNGSATVYLYANGSGKSIQTWGEYTGVARFNWHGGSSTLTFNYTSPLVTTERSTGKVINKPVKDGTVSCEFGGNYLEIGGVMYR